jgi:alkylation response protein AidB-like acyl-CoA dehydrogenase
VRFAFTDDQLALRDAVRDLLAKECPPEVVRAAWPEPDADGQGPGAGARSTPGQLAAVWQHLADIGVLGLLVPEAQGGLGFDEVAAALVLEETGYVAVPHPVVEAVCVAAPALGDPAPGREAIGWGEAALPGEVVDRSLVVRGPGTEVDAQAFDRAALGTAAQLIGLSRRMLDLTVAYVIDRHQFGVPIGSFQAVKHHLADARLQLEFATPAVYRAAWSLGTGAPTAERDVSMAKALASDCAHVVGRKALQCHGGIGYTVEYDLHLLLKRAWALATLWGDAAWHRDRVGRALGI